MRTIWVIIALATTGLTLFMFGGCVGAVYGLSALSTAHSIKTISDMNKMTKEWEGINIAMQAGQVAPRFFLAFADSARSIRPELCAKKVLELRVAPEDTHTPDVYRVWGRFSDDCFSDMNDYPENYGHWLVEMEYLGNNPLTYTNWRPIKCSFLADEIGDTVPVHTED